ncbi:acetylxylan esterase [Cohnella hashimotonis]|uniref:Alpha/beta fold hydrolase n=1 Tax=Cohnella hashimotonis TaxID=2826895 RepID=A0ABT6TSX7_9BACL|nr:alpha/beta fold hydrolase [Cohnella hashimotonis]MDI4649829.1 alpha/beta fold hydrolase [Cohnella hashimotonis]
MNAIQARIEALRQYTASNTAPDDLEAFWARACREADASAAYSAIQPAASPFRQAQVFKVIYAGAADTPVHAWFLLPPDPLQQPAPCVVVFHGYSLSKGLPEEHAAWLLMGYAVLAVDVRGQGGDTGNGLPQAHGMAKGWITKGILDPERSYFRAIAIDALRAVRCAMAMPEVDPARVFAFGGSQGGGLALLAAALAPGLRAAIAHVPNMCHMDLGIMQSVGSIAEAADFATRFPDSLDDVLRTLSYFDIVNLADRIALPVHVTVGLKDTTCLPETIFAAYNRIASPDKSIEVHPFMGHAIPPGYYAAAHAFYSRLAR